VSSGAPPLLLVARIARAHGLRGELAVALVGDDPGRVSEGRELWFEKGVGLPRLLRVASRRGRPERPLVRFEGVETREQAEALAGGELSVRFDPADLAAGEYYAHQLEGLRVATAAGVEVGRVAGVVFGPGRAFLEVAAAGRKSALLVPFHGDIVLAVDLDRSLVTIDPPPGLLDL
jgi:16S rRNA processing protein RimM